jgi:hypothetical protein
MQKCQTCKFYFPLDRHDGHCRRFPPMAVKDPRQPDGTNHLWPEVFDNEWCGEHQPS